MVGISFVVSFLEQENNSKEKITIHILMVR
jgi:hypothetical protein